MDMKAHTSSATVPQIGPDWTFADYLGMIKVRSAIGRDNYKVTPGLYRFGNPDAASDVFVTGNYKLSFDILRKNLAGLDAWILVLDSKGINVWCAAGKGTFGADELQKRIQMTGLADIVSHRRLIIPQLGAPGIAAHTIKENTGFRVKFGPVNASDIKAYVNNGYRKDESMRTVPFNLKDRALLTPIEVVNSLHLLLLVVLLFIFLSGFSKSGYSLQTAWDKGLLAAVYIVSAYLAGTIITPVLLPWLPFRSFSGKGLLTGVVLFTVLIVSGISTHQFLSIFGFLLLTAAISSFLAMNYTGTSNYTSLSGVIKEMRIYVPVQIVLASLGAILIIVSNFTESLI